MSNVVFLIAACLLSLCFIWLQSSKIEQLKAEKTSLSYQLANADEAVSTCNKAVEAMRRDQEKADATAKIAVQTVEVETVKWRDRVVVELQKDPSCKNELLLITQQLKEVLSL